MLPKKLTILLVPFFFQFHSFSQESDSIASIEMTQTIKGFTITLLQDEVIQHAEYQPVFLNRRVFVQNYGIISVDSLFSTNDLLNDAFSFHTNSIHVRKSSKKELLLRIFLGQSGCVGSLCSDLLIIEVSVKNGKLSFNGHSN